MIKSKAGKSFIFNLNSKGIKNDFFSCPSVITMFNKIAMDYETTLHAWKSEVQVINWTKLVIKNSIQTNSRSKSKVNFFMNNIFH